MGGGGGGEWWKRSSVGLACRVGEDCARRARAGEEDQTAQESKLDPSSNASVRSYGFSLEQWIVTVADRKDRDRHLRVRYLIHRCSPINKRAGWRHAPLFTSPLRKATSLYIITKKRTDHLFRSSEE